MTPAPDWTGLWSEVESLVSEQKLEAASSRVAEIRAAALERGDQDQATRALIEEVKLRTALHGFETAVRFLREEPWPESPLQRAVVRLFYAHSLTTYLQAYSWEIEQRERVETGDEVDLKRWTREQILEEARRAFAGVWSGRKEWGAESLGSLAQYLEQNDYPARIRGTLRDAVTYLWVEMLGDASWWSPRHSNQIYLLDLSDLMAGEPAGIEESDLAASRVHPLSAISFLLGDLESWHRENGRPEAAFEARLERLRRLHLAFSRDEDRVLIRAELESSLARLGRRFSWWSMGMSALAEMVRDSGEMNSLVTAREIALEGREAHPDSIGGRRCRAVVAAIEAPAFSLQSMRSDAPGRRSIEVRHRNLETLHFRAWKVDLLEHLASSRDYNLLPGYREVPEIMGRQSPTATWEVGLPTSEDFGLHRTFVTPPLDEAGLYVVAASTRRDFRGPLNRRSAVSLMVGDPVMVTRSVGEGLEVTVRSGRTGAALPGAEVSLWRYDYRAGHRVQAARTTDAAGVVTFPVAAGVRRRVFAVARYGEELAIDHSFLQHGEPAEPQIRTAAMVFTDRTVYRPLQSALWKVVAYEGGGPDSRFEVLPERTIRVELLDANGQVVEATEVTTNRFGSAAGEFRLPAGHLLGAWRLRTSLGGGASIRVEEYKRPTFEATVEEPEEPLRLNREASLRGTVRYYFGLPVAEGGVVWRVERVPILPRWWFWDAPRPESRPEVVAAGETRLASDGTFGVTFLPRADERQSDEPGISYRFRLSVDVTDQGGETRSASRVFRLGFVAVEAAIEAEVSFVRAGRPARFSLRRTDLDGAPRSGSAAWRLHALKQPDEALLPAALPVESDADEDAFRTAGDLLRPRWESGYSPQRVMAAWAEGAELRRGELSHGEDGLASLELDRLAPGAYRLSYATEDEFGSTFETSRDFLVAAPGQAPLAVAALLAVERSSVPVGETARLLVHSGLAEQEMTLEIFRSGRRRERRVLTATEGLGVLEIPVAEADRGGFSVRLTCLRDHQLITLSESVLVPWDDRELKLEFATFRERLRPGTRETWRVRVTGADGAALERGAGELLAYMYDRSLDLFAPHSPPRALSLYPLRTGLGGLDSSLGAGGEIWSDEQDLVSLPEYPTLRGDRLRFYDGYAIGGMGRRSLLGGPQAMTMRAEAMDRPAEEAAELSAAEPAPGEAKRFDVGVPEIGGAEEAEAGEPPDSLRTDFAETAFWEPQLLLGDDGSVAFEFTVPDSVTEWNVWVHALTRDLRGGSLNRQARSFRELMVRPYLPRFLREGDRAALEVVVNNAGERELSGRLDFEILDPESGESLLAEFGLEPADGRGVPFSVLPGGGTTLEFPVRAPARVGEVHFRVTARAGDLSDGELRPMPLLPGRMHLAQSRFVTLRDAERRELYFADLAAADDPTRIDEQLVVTLDAQLFYSVLGALPYLVDYPYECTEQILNRFVSTGIVSSLYQEYPAVAAMAEKLSARETRLETWDSIDPNRKMVLEETPWLRQARGGEEPAEVLVNVLDPRIAEAERVASLAKLTKAQTSLGGFPWWPGGPPSPYMTLYLLHGLSKALEFGVEVPRDMVVRAWSYMHRHFLDEMVRDMAREDCCWQMVTFLNYVLSNFPDESWTGGVFSADDRSRMLDFSFRHWKEHAPGLKGYLALTLHRAGREADANLVFDSVMDSARTTQDQGTFWAPEERSWLWYNDTIESHAYALRTLTELDPDDGRRHGLVQWLLLNKKLSHWKSTRATAEVIYSLVHYLEREGTLAAREEVRVAIGPKTRTFVFEPDEYTGKSNQLVVEGEEIDPAAMSSVVVEKETPGFLFASATWHFSTERLPEEARGDFFAVERRFFERESIGDEWVLRPVEEGAALEPGDQVEVHLSIRAKHAAEYVHLRDPRGAGFEPETTASSYKWDLGIGWYEEVRDSGTNFFFDWLPAGEYTFRYRLRATTGGTFRVAPAVLQSMYAPEFAAYSTGDALTIAAED